MDKTLREKKVKDACVLWDFAIEIVKYQIACSCF